MTSSRPTASSAYSAQSKEQNKISKLLHQKLNIKHPKQTCSDVLHRAQVGEVAIEEVAKVGKVVVVGVTEAEQGVRQMG